MIPTGPCVCVQHTSYPVKSLEVDHSYQFRVSAANKHGFSEPSELSELVTMTNPEDAPSDDGQSRSPGFPARRANAVRCPDARISPLPIQFNSILLLHRTL